MSLRSMILKNARILELDPPAVREGELHIEEGLVVSQGSGPELDLGGAWVMPGLVNAHTHLYSALACGMPLPAHPPETFTRMLEQVWWRLDQAHDQDSVEVSALVGGLAALRAGVTTVIDHHASPRAITGSLERVDGALATLGLRRVLCYEVSDRHGRAGALEGIRAHERLLGERGPSRGVLVGMHAAFTLSDESIRDCVSLARSAGVGVHIHLAESIDDLQAGPPLARLQSLGALLPGSIFAHGVHLEAGDRARLEESGAWLSHQARSNMNNGVGQADHGRYPSRTALGTDGIGSDMLAELQTAVFRANERPGSWGLSRLVQALADGARLASAQLGLPLGRLQPGQAADLVVLDPCPGPPLTEDNLAAALVFRLSSQQVRHVMVDGQWRLWDRQPTGLDPAELDRRAQQTSLNLWSRMAAG